MDALTRDDDDRKALRKQLRHAGWTIGTMTRTSSGVVLELWPAPHTGPSEGVEPWRVTGTDKTDALRQAVLGDAAPPADES